ncbi:methyltransferase domain-containing protein [Candidatus Jorgensenbacteria bacterium]|nr:methyltransferase domain-containing protein [Candidatus Jorgensenbacteria bacterium]
MKKSTFLKEYLKHPKIVGAVSPASKFLIENVVKAIDFSKADVIVELGAGHGNFTKALLKRMNRRQKILVFEIHPAFFADLSKTIKDSRAILINDTAQKLDIYLKQHGIVKANYVVSSLPLTLWPLPEVEKLLRRIKNILAPNGKLIQWTYFMKHLSFFKQHFSRIRLKFTLFNFPPTFVYVCSKE